MNRMLINAAQPGELRVALLDETYLYDLDIERPGQEQKKANIYKGRITRIEPSLEAAFVDYSADRHGFLPLKEIARSCFASTPQQQHPHIKDVLQEGQELVIQVDKEERGSKGAALTTFISLAGSYLVLMPNNPRAGGISRRIEGQERDELRNLLGQLDIPDGMGVIVRTAGVRKSLEELRWDLDTLLKQWSAIEQASKERPAPFLIYQESDVVIRAIRDYLRMDIGEIMVDNPEVQKQIIEHIHRIRPDFVEHVKLYQDTTPIFSHYKIERQIESAFQRKVTLPSGGSIVIDRAEALVAIDINSARATAGSDIEETALNTNIEAADEIARQLRLRDLGGLIVIDFIDMTPIRNQRQVEQRLRNALRLDRARIQIGRVSRFGLLEMSRQRLRPAIAESVQVVCPRCGGQGTIRGTESLISSLIRLIEEESLREKIVQIQVQLPVDAATFLLNERREVISQIESRHNVNVIIIPNRHLKSPHYKINSLTQYEARKTGRSYQMAELPEEKPSFEEKTQKQQRRAEPAVKQVALPLGPGAKKGKKKAGLIKRLWENLFSTSAAEEQKQPQQRTPIKRSHPPSRQQPSRSTRGGTQRSGSRSTGGRTRTSRGGTRPRHSSSSQANQARTPYKNVTKDGPNQHSSSRTKQQDSTNETNPPTDE